MPAPRGLAVVAILFFAAGCGAKVPRIFVSTAALDFGNDPAGSQTTRPITVANTGKALLTLASATITGDVRGAFSVGALPQPLVESASATLSITYTAPATVGQDAATLTLTSDASGAPTFTIALTGVTTASTAQRLVFTQLPPGSAQSGVTLTQAVTVTVEDSAGNVEAASNAQITLSSSGGTLTGGSAVAAVGGVARFTGLALAGPAGLYTLTASSPSLTSASSELYLTAGASSRLVFTQAPSFAASGAATSAQVSIEDASGNIVTASTAPVTLSSSGGTLLGTGPVNAVAGVATFSNLSITGTAGSYTLTASSSATSPALSSTTSALNLVAGAPTQLAFAQALPSTAQSGSTLPPVSVVIEDSAGNITSSTAPVNVSAGGGTLTGATALDAINGVATFDNLSLAALDGTYVVTAVSSQTTLAPVAATLIITAGAAVATTSILTAPASVASGSKITVVLQAEDGVSNPLTTGGAAVAFSVVSGTGSGSLGAVTDNHNGSYSASLTGVLAGTVSVRAKLNGVLLTSTASVTVTPGMPAAATSTLTSATSVASGLSIPATLQAVDAAGNNLKAGGATVAFSVLRGGGSGSLGAVTDNSNGTYSVSFTGSLAGLVTLQASLNGAQVTSTAPVTVTVGAPTTLTAATATGQSYFTGSQAPLAVQVTDFGGNNVTGATVTWAAQGGTCTSPTSSASSGQATSTATFAAGSNIFTASLGSLTPVIITATGIALTISPTTVDLQEGDVGATFSVPASASTVTWTFTPSDGALSATSGASVNYTTPPVGTLSPTNTISQATTVTVTATSGAVSASATIALVPWFFWPNWSVPPASVNTSNYTLTSSTAQGYDYKTVKDGVTGLVWQEVSSNSMLNILNPPSTFVHGTEAEAEAYCTSLDSWPGGGLGGYSSGWRLPSRVELSSIMKFGNGNSAESGEQGCIIDLAAFPYIESQTVSTGNQYWTSTPLATAVLFTGVGQTEYWYGDFGTCLMQGLEGDFQARCVHDP